VLRVIAFVACIDFCGRSARFVFLLRSMCAFDFAGSNSAFATELLVNLLVLSKVENP
jgi:hypothetical protein